MEEEIKFGVEEDSLYQLLNPNVCEYQKPGEPFTVEETNETGKAVVTIYTKRPGFVVRCLDDKGNIRTLPFFNQTWKGVTTTCADHLLFLFDKKSGAWALHVFELKRSPDSKKWEHILEQFNGAMVRAYAIAGVLRIAEFVGVYLHCGYRKDKSNLISNKQIGLKSKRPKEPPPESFLRQEIKLFSYPNLSPKNEPIQLSDTNGTAVFRPDIQSG